MQSLLNAITPIISLDVGSGSVLRFGLLLAAGALILGLVIHLIRDQCAELRHVLSAAMGILFVYAVSVLIYIFDPAGLSRYLSPLPFVTLDGDQLHIFLLAGSSLPAVSAQLLSMVILAFLVNLLDGIIPKGEKLLSWLMLRILTVALSMALHFVVTWAFNTFLPGTLAAYAPMILLGILTVFLLIGVLRFLLGLVLTIANPILGAIYAFFFSSKFGKQLTRAVFTTMLLAAVAFCLPVFGCGTLSLDPASLRSLIPASLLAALVWRIIRKE